MRARRLDPAAERHCKLTAQFAEEDYALRYVQVFRAIPPAQMANIKIGQILFESPGGWDVSMLFHNVLSGDRYFHPIEIKTTLSDVDIQPALQQVERKKKATQEYLRSLETVSIASALSKRIAVVVEEFDLHQVTYDEARSMFKRNHVILCSFKELTLPAGQPLPKAPTARSSST